MVKDIPGSLHGAWTRQHAKAVLGEYGVRSAVESGVLVPLWPRVLVDSRRQLEPMTRAAAGLLTVGPSGVLCGFTAARLHGCDAAPPRGVEVLVPYDAWPRQRSGLVVRYGRIEPEDACVVDGLRVLQLDLTISELLCAGPARPALACADQACRAQPPAERAAFVQAVKDRLDVRRDRRRTRRATILAGLVNAGAESPPESWLRLIVVDSGFPPPVVQHEVCGIDGLPLWRLDLAWPTVRVGLEYDGYAAHAGRERRDAARDEDLRRRGWIIVHTTADDLQNPRRVLDELSEAFHRRGGFRRAA